MNLKSYYRKGFFFLALSFVLIQGVIACGGNSYLPNSSYQGTVAGNTGFTAVITLPVNTDYSSENVTGVLDPAGGGESINLVGSLTTTGALTASGGGYTFTGTATSGVLLGTFTGPSSTTGGFTALDSTENTITTYCGTFTGTSSGTWNMETSSGHTAAATAASASSSTLYSGSVSGNSITLSSTSGSSATGTISGNTVNGTWTATGGASGSFTANVGNCQ